MNNQLLKRMALEALEQNKSKITEIADDLFHIPELGYCEEKTAAYVERMFREIGLSDIRTGLAITGVRGMLAGGGHAGNVAIAGELDAILCPDHPNADPVTAAAHACGHYMQLTVMLAAALALRGIMPELAGSVAFLAVPCEEGTNLQTRECLYDTHHQWYQSGKQEWIRRGYVADVDAALMVHSAPTGRNLELIIPCSSNATLRQKITIHGKEAHVGGEMHQGVNALSAANLLISALDSLRQTFPEGDRIRLNTIIHHAGESVNTVPNTAVLELEIRARKTEIVQSVSQRVERAVHGCCYAIGATADIRCLSQYISMLPAGEKMIDIVRQNGNALAGKNIVQVLDDVNICTDTADFSVLFPTIQLSCGGGFDGNHHQRDFLPVDSEYAYFLPAKILICSVVDILANSAQGLRDVRKAWRGGMSREEYLKKYVVDERHLEGDVQ